MDSKRITESIRKTDLEHLRTKILLLLDDAYPDPVHSDIIWYRLRHEERHSAGLNNVTKELNYLAEKGLLRLENIVEKRYLVAISPRGRDFVCGHLTETGLADTALFR